MRTDTHRPSAINPEEYEYVACEHMKSESGDLIGDCAVILAHREMIRAHMARTGGTYSHHDHGGNCHICGAWAVYTVLFYHRPTNTYIRTGEDCADKLDCGGMEHFRKQVKRGLEARAGKKKAQAVLASKGMDAAWAIYQGSPGSHYEEGIVRDLVAKLIQYGSMSEKQEAFLASLLLKIKDRPAREAAIAAAKAEDAAKSQHLGTVGERRDFTVTCQWKTSFGTDFGMVTVHGFKDDAGNVIIYKGRDFADRGEIMTIKATIKEHGEREGVKQTIISRPKVLEMLTQEAA